MNFHSHPLSITTPKRTLISSMKLVLLLLLPFALCAIQRPFPEAAYQAYSLKDEALSREEFERIDEFISRIEEADDKDLVSEKDKEMLLEMGFESFLSPLLVPECLRDQDETDSDVTWGEINDSTRLLETRCDENNTSMIFENGVPFAKVLRFIYSFENVDALSIDEFFRRHCLLCLLKDGKQMNIKRQLKSLHQVYGTILSNSLLDSFAHKNEEFIMVLLSILTDSALSIDLKLLKIRPSLEVDSIVEDILKILAGNIQFKGISKLEKIEFRASVFDERTQLLLFQILKQNTESLTSLEIHVYRFLCPEEILFPNVQKLTLNLLFIDNFNFKFLHHSNYTTLNLHHNVAFTEINGKQYFGISYTSENITSFVSLIEDNKNLDTFAWNWLDNGVTPVVPKEGYKSLKSAVSSLKHLTSFEFYDFPKYFEEYVPANSCLKSLKMQDPCLSKWKSVREKFPNLKHLEIQILTNEHLGKFVEFAQSSQLQSVALMFWHSRGVNLIKIDLLSTLSKIRTLEKINLRMSFLEKLPASHLDKKFKVIDFYHANTFSFECNPPTLPFGPGVVHLRIQKNPFRKGPFTSEDFKILKQKFPNLKRLVLPYGSSVEVQPDEFEIEMQTNSKNFDDLLNQFPSLTLSY